MRKKGKKRSYTSTVANDLVIVVPKCTYLLPPHKTSTPSLVNSKETQIKIKERNYKDRLRSRRFIQGVTQVS
jgi:hypothetical protein